MLRTTINMNNAVFDKIGRAADRLGTSKRAIVVMLLMRLRHDHEHFRGGFSLVKYQPRDPLKQWHCFTITFKEQENELVSDFRRLGKFSVSFFVSKAMERYLNELLNDRVNSHNYVGLDQYTIGQSEVCGVICWELYWGPHPDPPKERSITRILRRTSIE